tara:strand:- start:793 stop:1671 length:879 start_codon:yes stop_codon:yes gene_type:complete
MKNKIFICICTNNRKLKLFKNLISILGLKNFSIYDIEIILVSNDRSSYEDFLEKFKNTLKISFFRESLSGVSYSRNRILKILRNKKFDYGIFVDDDCIFSQNWLISMMKVLKKEKVDIVGGPQITKSNNIFLRIMERNFRNKQEIKWASTNNVIFKSNILKNDINFNNKLNNIGGEDQLFFLSLNKIGKKIFWNPDAPVFELSDKKRENLKWFIKRNLRYGSSAVIIYKSLYGNFLGYLILLIKLMNDFRKLIIFLIKTLFLSKKNFYSFLMYKARILGVFFGLLGFQIKEY